MIHKTQRKSSEFFFLEREREREREKEREKQRAMATSVSVPEVSGNIVITGVNGGTTDHESAGVNISVNIAAEEENGGTRKECACVTGSAPRGTRGGGRGGGNAGRPTRFIWRPARDKRNIPKGWDGGYVHVHLHRWLVLSSRASQPSVAHLEDVFVF